jgi:hypothetical protein
VTANSDVEDTSVEADTMVIDVASMVVVSTLVVVASVVVSAPVVTSVEAETTVELKPDAGPDLVSLFSSKSNGDLTQRPGFANTCVCGPEASKTEHGGMKNTETHGNPMQHNGD